MVATHGEVVARGVGEVASFDFAHTPPVHRGGIAVLLAAGYDAALAADALRHVEVKAILLARSRLTVGQEARGRQFDLH